MLGFAKSEPRVQFVRPPAIVSDQDTIVLQVRVEPDAENRLLVVMAVDGDDVVRRSDEALAGADAPRTRWIRWRLSSGELILQARVYGSAGQRGIAVQPILVRGRFD